MLSYSRIGLSDSRYKRKMKVRSRSKILDIFDKVRYESPTLMHRLVSHASEMGNRNQISTLSIP